MPEDLRQYLYLKVAGSESERFDPEAISVRTGLKPSESWRLGDAAGASGRTRRFDFWQLDSPLGRTADLSAQIDTLLAHLGKSWTSVVETLKPLGPVLQYVVYTAQQPVQFEFNKGVFGKLLDLGAEVDYDLYWVCDPNVRNGSCDNCDIAVPCEPEVAKFYIGGERRVAEMQCGLTIYGVDKAAAIERFNLDNEETSSRLDDGLDVCFIESLGCLHFSSDFVPASDYMPPLAPEKWALQFARAVAPLMAKVEGGTHREFFINLTERSDFQGTAGLHFDLEVLHALAELDASMQIRLRYLPEPFLRANGECVLCDIQVVG